MQRALVAAAVFVAVVSSKGPVLSQSPLPSTDAAIGVWPWLVGNIDGSVPAIMAQTQAAGLDTVYLNLFRTSGVGVGTLHMVDEAGTWNPAWGPVDPDVTLTAFIAQAHAAGLQVIGVVNCFLDPAPLPGNTVHETVLLSVVDYLLHSFTGSGDPVYRLDGIALDRVRFYSGLGNPHQVVTAFVQQLKAQMGLVPLHAFLAANPWHIDGPPYDGSFRSYTEAMGLLQSQYGQHWEDLAALLEVNLPMAYVADGGVYGTNHTLMRAYLNTVASYARQAATLGGFPNQRILPAVRAWNDSTGTTSAASLDACLEGSLLGGADGFMPFRYFTMQGQTSWWNAVAGRAVAGSHLPLAALAVSGTTSLSPLLDASASSSQIYPNPSLEVHFDLDDDGLADTGWSTTKTWTFAAPGPGPYRVAVQVRDPAGRMAVRKLRFTLTSPVAAFIFAPGFTHIAAGGTHTGTITAGATHAGLAYVIAASASGTSPGTVLPPGITVPLVYDAYTEALLALANSPLMPGFVGTLDAAGSGTGNLVLPPGAVPPVLAWHTFWFAAAGIQPATLQAVFATNAATLLILP